MDLLVADKIDKAFLLLVAPFAGSFVGVLITRLPSGQPVLVGRSICPLCGHVLSARDLVPIVAWLLQGAKCRYCAARIGAFYPAIEIGALFVALWAVLVMPGWLAWATGVFGWLLLSLALIDDRHRLLPDPLVLLLAVVGLGVAWISSPDQVWAHVIGLLLGFLAFQTVRVTYRWLRGRDGLGSGDAKLLGAIGAWVSWEGLATVMLYAAVTGLLGTLIRRGSRTDVRLETSLAFGPYLCLGAWLVWLYGPLELTH